MTGLTHADILTLYNTFHSPIAAFDCGNRCSPYNEYGIPFCCDTRHVIPSAYQSEWRYLQDSTDLWHLWQAENPEDTIRLREQAQPGQVLIECRGHLQCQRGYRSIACRTFPFFPYISSSREFLGLSIYWEYVDRCWVISNLHAVTGDYCQEAVSAFEMIFVQSPADLDHFASFSESMRGEFKRKNRMIPLLHRNGQTYKISAGNERMHCVGSSDFPKFGVYRLAASLPFPGEE